MDKTQFKFLKNNGFTADKVFDKGQLEELKLTLLAIDGIAVCLPRIEEDKEKILTRGKLRDGKNAILHKGRPCRCHSNVCDLYVSNKKYKIMTGYAMSKDGIWRQHSWSYYKGIIETTERRVHYFGFMMNKLEANEFCESN